MVGVFEQCVDLILSSLHATMSVSIDFLHSRNSFYSFHIFYYFIFVYFENRNKAFWDFNSSCTCGDISPAGSGTESFDAIGLGGCVLRADGLAGGDLHDYVLMSCKLNGVDPEDYLRHVLNAIADWWINRVSKLLPCCITLPTE